MKVHELPTDPSVFDDILNERQTFDLRHSNKGFSVGDEIILQRTDKPLTEREKNKNEPMTFSDVPHLCVEVVHILKARKGLSAGWYAIGITIKRRIRRDPSLPRA